jgi:hypothetical protein
MIRFAENAANMDSVYRLTDDEYLESGIASRRTTAG